MCGGDLLSVYLHTMHGKRGGGNEHSGGMKMMPVNPFSIWTMD
jgi:hypothetical protein